MSKFTMSAVKDKLVSIDGAIDQIENNDRIWVVGAAVVSYPIMDRLAERCEEFAGVQLHGMMFLRPTKIFDVECKGHVDYYTLFCGPLERAMYRAGKNVILNSVSYSNYSNMIQNVAKANVVMVSVSAPNEDGVVSLAQTGACCTNLLLQDDSIKVILVVNKNLPFVLGEENLVKLDRADYIVELDDEVPTLPYVAPSEVEQQIAKHAATLINDGDCIQLGIGSVATATGDALMNHKNLGVHTELYTDVIMNLTKAGVITNKYKSVDQGKGVFGVALGTQELVDFLDHNPELECRPLEQVNNPLNVAKIDNFKSVNACLMMDLTGQAASEGAGFEQISGTGGQLDFVIGANLAKGGHTMLTLVSTAKSKSGEVSSSIVLALPVGTAVTTPRSLVGTVITEYGIADIRNQPLQERTRRLIAIAHPDFREELTAEAQAAGLLDAA